MPKKISEKKSGNTPPNHFRLGEDTVRKLDELVAMMGAATRTEAVRRLIHEAHKKGTKA